MRLKTDHPALSENRTIHRHAVKNVSDYKGKIFKPASENKKLGNGDRTILKGAWRGMPMYSLTLEERATCPDTCFHWRDCYGNGMAFAHRFKAGKDLENRIRAELSELAGHYPFGFVIRLHVLGDFYSVDYVDLWTDALIQYPNLRIFGYTARDGNDAIGFGVAMMGVLFPDRCWIRQSVKVAPHPIGIYATAEPGNKSITCPQQLGKTRSCLTCALCWSVNLPIHFVNHDALRKEKHNAHQNQ